MAGEMWDLNGTLVRMEKENDQLREEIDSLKAGRKNAEYKAACKEMEQKVAVAAKQLKVVNVEVGGAITDRRQLAESAKKQLKEKVRSDLRAKYDSMMAKAAFAVIAKEPKKTFVEGKEAWTVPVVITAQDKETKWDMEDVLRRSKVFPAFHWPKDLVEPVAELRKMVINQVGENHYVRIRPEEREGEGVWRLRADVKGKGNSDRFAPFARWNMPPANCLIRKSDWATPCWVARKPTTIATSNMQIDYTADVDLNNFGSD
jgi:hypothetical protein